MRKPAVCSHPLADRIRLNSSGHTISNDLTCPLVPYLPQPNDTFINTPSGILIYTSNPQIHLTFSPTSSTNTKAIATKTSQAVPPSHTTFIPWKNEVEFILVTPRTRPRWLTGMPNFRYLMAVSR